MKNVELIASGANYTAVSVGTFAELGQHKLTVAPGVEMPGKVFAAKALGATGAEISFTTLPVGQGVDFLHTHTNNEELYVVVKGCGEYQVDGEIFKIGEGSVVKVAPQGKRTYRNTGDEPLVVICIQSKSDSLCGDTFSDGKLLDEAVVWK